MKDLKDFIENADNYDLDGIELYGVDGQTIGDIRDDYRTYQKFIGRRRMENMKLEYDNYGRMKYNPFFHGNTGKSWSRDDINYLLEWHGKIDGEEMSFALERTIVSIYQKYAKIKKELQEQPN